jgi:Myb-like DNA-binding domain
MNALCQHVVENDLGEEGLIDLCSKSKDELSSELKGAWCHIAESLPNRSVQSCHNFCRRKFNPNNYHGKWTREEEETLMRLVEENGHSWKEIAHAINSMYADDEDLNHKFGRTPENVKDKWKQLGGENSSLR